MTRSDSVNRPYGADQLPLGTTMGSEGLRAVNSAGQLLRIGQRELLMVLDVGDGGFELYQLRR